MARGRDRSSGLSINRPFRFSRSKIVLAQVRARVTDNERAELDSSSRNYSISAGATGEFQLGADGCRARPFT